MKVEKPFEPRILCFVINHVDYARDLHLQLLTSNGFCLNFSFEKFPAILSRRVWSNFYFVLHYLSWSWFLFLFYKIEWDQYSNNSLCKVLTDKGLEVDFLIYLVRCCGFCLLFALRGKICSLLCCPKMSLPIIWSKKKKKNLKRDHNTSLRYRCLLKRSKEHMTAGCWNSSPI